ncbi:FAD-dependent oxidoreductase, partial [[Clostridium] symbiosum]
ARFAVTGVEADKIAVDMAALQARKKAVVKTLVNGVKGLLRGNKVTVVEGMASFADTHTLSVDGRSITGANIIIATGSSVFMPPFIALEGENHLLTSTEALDLDQV